MHTYNLFKKQQQNLFEFHRNFIKNLFNMFTHKICSKNSNKICSNFTETSLKKICSTCSHIKSVQKPVQSIQKFVQSVQIVQICSHKQSVQISSFHTHINNQSKFHYFIINLSNLSAHDKLSKFFHFNHAKMF